MYSLLIREERSNSTPAISREEATKSKFSLTWITGKAVSPLRALYMVCSGSSARKEAVRFACASKSIRRVLYPLAAKMEPKAATEVVLPTPPLWFATAITRAIVLYLCY